MNQLFEASAFSVVDIIMSRLGITLDMETDPTLIAEILRRDMRLDGFEPLAEGRSGATEGTLGGASSARREEGAYREHVTNEQRRDATRIPLFTTERNLFGALGTSLNNPVPLRPMLEQIRASLVSKHPTILEVLCVMYEEDWLPRIDDAARSLIKRALNHAFVLHAITRAMLECNDIMLCNREHLSSVRTKAPLEQDPGTP